MNLNQQRQAQQRVDRIAAFRAELTELEREEGLRLTSEQRLALEAHHERLLTAFNRDYGVDLGDSAKRISWGMRIVSLLGAIAFFVGLVLFLHRFWGALPFAAQAGVLVVSPLALLGVAARSSRKDLSLHYVGILALAAGAAFVMGLSALGGILNLAPSPHALVAWGGFAVLVAYAAGLRLILAAGLVLLAAYVGALGTAASGAFWGAFIERPVWLLPAAALLYGVPFVTRHPPERDFDFVYRICGAGLGLLALLVLSLGGDVCCAAALASTVEMLYQLAGLGVSVAVIAHGLRLGRGGLVNLGASGFVVFLLTRLHAWFWGWMPKYLFFVGLGLTAIALLLAFRRVRRRLAGSDKDSAFILNEPETGWQAGRGSPSASCGATHPVEGAVNEGRRTLQPRASGLRQAPWLWGAAALIMLAGNVGGIGSALRNRSAALGGTVELTERELTLPRFFEESTVLLLDLRWAAFPRDPLDERTPSWLTNEKLAELGFDCQEPLASPHARDHYAAMAPRPVFLVLEFQGEAWKPPNGERAPRTHLLAIDAGLDPARLREKHPDTGRQVIARGLVRPFVRTHDPASGKPLAEPHVGGRIQEVHPSLVFLPRPHSIPLQRLPRRTGASGDRPSPPPRYAVTVAWGKHYEPWVQSVRLLPSGTDGER